MKRFADRLREARVAAGMTQEQLGFALGITKSSVSAWENARETPSFRVLPELRRALGRSLDELVCGLQPAEASAIAEDKSSYKSREASPVARDEKERALLQRYRNLPPRRRAALLDLLRPETDITPGRGHRSKR
jgi:transcriptional regulator with XRE-family HTH domain